MIQSSRKPPPGLEPLIEQFGEVSGGGPRGHRDVERSLADGPVVGMVHELPYHRGGVHDHEAVRFETSEDAGQLTTKIERVLDVTVTEAEPFDLLDSHDAGGFLGFLFPDPRKRFAHKGSVLGPGRAVRCDAVSNVGSGICPFRNGSGQPELDVVRMGGYHERAKRGCGHLLKLSGVEDEHVRRCVMRDAVRDVAKLESFRSRHADATDHDQVKALLLGDMYERLGG